MDAIHRTRRALRCAGGHASRIARTRSRKIRADLARLDFVQPIDGESALDYAADALTEMAGAHTAPELFRTFQSSANHDGHRGRTLVAAFNPQLAAWSHSPFAVEAERYVIETFAAKFGLPQENVEGTFTSGGMEANHTALLTGAVSILSRILGTRRSGSR